MSIKVETKFNLFPRLPGDVKRGLSQVIRKTTLDVEGEAEQRSRVDTGQMKSGWQSEFPDALIGVVFNPVEHTIHNEWGTATMSAQPMIRPAIENNRKAFEQAIAAVLKNQGK